VSLAEELRDFLDRLSRIEPLQSKWGEVEAWASSVRPFLRLHFPDHLSDFERYVEAPKWVLSAGAAGAQSPVAVSRNAQTVRTRMECLRSQMESLAKHVMPVPKPAGNWTMVHRMPFRPYRRFTSQFIATEDLHDHFQRLAVDGSANEEELTRLGGREAIAASIKRHVPDFRFEEADDAYAPAWARLKPVLTKLGVQVDENTTLTDIKAYLDAAPILALTPTSPGEKTVTDPRRVFVVHGRNEPARKAMFDFLRALELLPIEWEQAVNDTGVGAPQLSAILDKAFSNAQAVLVLLTGDDCAYLRSELRNDDDEAYESQPTFQARPNVLFEAGMAMGRHPERTILVQIGDRLRPFSDIGGRHILRFNGQPKAKNTLRGRLKTAGCPVSEAGNDWLNSGDFSEALRLGNPAAKESSPSKPSKGQRKKK
jgi:predicted nucleotide-binding protein